MSAVRKLSNHDNPLLDKKIVNAFIDGVVKTLETMAGKKVKTGTPHVMKKFTAKGDIAGMIGMVSSNVQGTITLSFEENVIYTVLQGMLDEEHSSLSDEVQDAVGELTNMIYGTAKTILNSSGYQFEMAIPTVITGKFEIHKSHQGTTLITPFSLEENEDQKLYVIIAIQKSEVS